MLGRQSVRVTYARKKRRVQNPSEKPLSSPLEVLAPDVNDLTRTQMARRMLKRSRRVALADQLEDKDVEHIREHLAKRIKRAQDRGLNTGPAGAPSGFPPQDNFASRTPFPQSKSASESTAISQPVPEQLSPVPVARRVMSRASSRNLKENTMYSQTLASPFSSRPGSAVSSPKKHKGRERSSRRVSRKDSTVSLKDTNKEPSRHIKHQRYPSSPSASYMRSRFTQEDWIPSPNVLLCTFDRMPSPAGSLHSDASFYVDQPQFCSTPAMSRLRKLTDLHSRQARTDNLVASFSLRKDPIEAGNADVDMVDGTLQPRRQTVRLSGNSIFSSSGEFTIGTLPVKPSGSTVERKNAADRDEASARVNVNRQLSAHHGAVDGPQADHSLAGSFVVEYDISLSDPDHSRASTAATKMLGPEGKPKLSVGEQPFGLPGTSPMRGETGGVHTSREPGVHKSSIGERPGTSPARGKSSIFRTSRNTGTLTQPASPIATCPPSSPAPDLALEFQSMDIRGDLDTHRDGETHRPSTSIPFQTRSRSLRDAVAESTTKKAAKRMPARNRAGTIRASDFARSGALSSGTASGLTASPSNVRRTRSGTVVGLDSKLAARGVVLPSQAVKSVPTTNLAVVQSASESESDDELLLKCPWIEDMKYLGPARPRVEAEADELNLGGVCHDLEFDRPRRLGSRRR